MSTTYDFRIHQSEVYKGKRTTTHYVRWSVAGKRWCEGFRVKAQAESFRAELVRRAGRGEAFEVETGLPVSMRRHQQDMPWYDLACKFVDLKRPRNYPPDQH